jgi:hypothetical protein
MRTALLLSLSAAILGFCPARALGNDPSAAQGFALLNGDGNGDGTRDLADGVFLLRFAFLGGSSPVPLALCDGNEPVVENGDIDGNGAIDVADSVRLLGWLFFRGRPPVPACAPGEDRVRTLGPDVVAYGNSLAEWMALYWVWSNAGADPAQGQIGKVAFLPLPAGNYLWGEASPEKPMVFQGYLDVSFPAGTILVWPEDVWSLELYDPSTGAPPDPRIPDDVMLGSMSDFELDLKSGAFALTGYPPAITVDGVRIQRDFNEYYVAVDFDPPLLYPQPSPYGSIGIRLIQGFGALTAPLEKGVHRLSLHECSILPEWINDPESPEYDPAFGTIPPLGFCYDNTWTITVK